jgi:putative ABC transport system substrate-binding protein
MTVTIGRRKLLAALGAAAIAWPLAARAQQPAMPVLVSSTPPRLVCLCRGLNHKGFVEGRNIAIECRFAAIVSGATEEERQCAKV